MVTQLVLGDISVRVERKDIKNVHLGVYPPSGGVRIAAPKRMSTDAIRALAISKLGWIRRQRSAFAEQERETLREYLEGESHYLWGRRYLLAVEEGDETPVVEVSPRRLVLKVRPGTGAAKRTALVDAWYRRQLSLAVAPLLAKWEPLLGVKAGRILPQRMKTKWGSCNPETASIRLNTDLAKKPRACLEYVVVHELVHLRAPKHDAHFLALMDRFIPGWRHHREQLNRLPVRHEEWRYSP